MEGVSVRTYFTIYYIVIIYSKVVLKVVWLMVIDISLRTQAIGDSLVWGRLISGALL